MILRRSVKHHVSMGNYEWIEFGAEVELDDAETDDESAELAVERILENVLADDIAEARLNTDEKNSYIHLYKKES